MIQVTKGMRDFYPEDYQYRDWLFSIFRAAALQSGFEFYDSPVVEAEELYIRKAGEEISEQLYTFEDKSGRRLALRPEMTPSLARMVISRHKELPAVLKWSSIPQCFRYERMTRGRKREHYQWNLDYLGEPGVFAEAEVISTAILAIEMMGLGPNEVKVRISNRALLSDLLISMGLNEEATLKVFLQIDKLGKIPDEQMVEELAKIEGMPAGLPAQILNLVKIKDLPQVLQILEEHDGNREGFLQTQALFQYLESAGFGSYLVFDLSIVRGLAYYTGTVFEFFDAKKGLRAIAGGGRYDQLIETLADADLPEKSKGSIQRSAVGFGFGDVVIFELLKDHKKLPVFDPVLDYYLVPFSNEEVNYLLPVLGMLRRKGYSAQMHYPPQKPKKMFSKAEKLGSKVVLIAGSQEREERKIKVKDFQNASEELFDIDKWMV